MEPNLELISEIKKLNKNITKLYRSQSLSHSFLSGVLSGLGSVLGATLLVAGLVYLLRNVNLVPLIGSWLSQIT